MRGMLSEVERKVESVWPPPLDSIHTMLDICRAVYSKKSRAFGRGLRRCKMKSNDMKEKTVLVKAGSHLVVSDLSGSLLAVQIPQATHIDREI